MVKYSIDISNIDKVWTATIFDRVVVGKGATAGEAVENAIREAKNVERKFEDAGLGLPKSSSGSSAFGQTLRDQQRYALRVLVRFGLPVLILFVASTSFYLVIRPDIINQISVVRDKLLNDVHNVRIAVERIANKP